MIFSPFYFFPSHFSLWLPLSQRPSLPADKETEKAERSHRSALFYFTSNETRFAGLSFDFCSHLQRTRFARTFDG